MPKPSETEPSAGVWGKSSNGLTCWSIVVADPPVARAKPELVLVLASLDGVKLFFKDEVARGSALLLDVHLDDLPWRIGQGGGDVDGRVGVGVEKGDGDRDLGPRKIHGVGRVG